MAAVNLFIQQWKIILSIRPHSRSHWCESIGSIKANEWYVKWVGRVCVCIRLDRRVSTVNLRYGMMCIATTNCM